MPVEFRILGPLEVSANGHVLPAGSRKQRLLLGLLLIHPNETLSRDQLIEELWGEASPPTVGSALHVYLSRLRKVLEAAGVGGALAREAYGYRLRVEPDQLDANRFERLTGEGREALAAGNPALALERLRLALALWRGPALADLQSERFALAASARLNEQWISALELRLEADLALGRDRDLIAELETLVAEHPYRERLRAHLMLALYRSSRQVEALRAYQDTRRTLAEELGIEPSQELKDLEQAVLRQDASLTLERPLRPESGPSLATPGTVSEGRDERKVVSVLVADVRASTAPWEHPDPEELRAFRDRYRPSVWAEIERHGGTPEESVGGTVIAFFGAPRSHEDDPERAVRAGLAIRDWALHDGLAARVAVTTGEVVVQLDAAPFATEGRTAGDVIDLASRLQAVAGPNAILVDDRTYRAARHVVVFRARSRREVKGVTLPGRIWTALAARRPVGMPAGVPRRGRLVGRERELGLLLATLARVLAERAPELVTLVGVPGIGKSRLVDELRLVAGVGRAVRTHGLATGDGAAGSRDEAAITWLHGRSLPYGDGVSFYALAEIVRGLIGALESDADGQLEARLRRTVETVLVDAREAEWVGRQLRPLVGLAGTRPGIGRERDEVFAAWRRFIEALAESRPLVLVFENLQWADDALLDFIDGLAEWVSGVPLLILATARSELLERRPHWGGGKQNATTLSLPPLSEQESAELLAILSRRLPGTGEARSVLLAKVGGNPFCAEQYAQALDERGDSTDVLLPDTVQGMIAARIDMLPPEEKTLLQDAAVLGEAFSVGGLGAVGSVDRAVAEEHLRTLEHKQFVHRDRNSSIAQDAGYAFSHVLLRDVAYAQIPRAARAAKHRRAAAWLESFGRSQDSAEPLAHHYAAALELMAAAGEDPAEMRERARDALCAAGDRAIALNAAAAAARYYERAVEFSAEQDPARPQLLLRYASALYALGDSRQEQLLVQAHEALVSAGDLEAAAEAEALLAKMWWFVGGHREVELHLERAGALVDGRPASPAKARVLALIADLRLRRWQLAEAIEAGRDALTIASRLDLPDLRADALLSVGMARFRAGEPAGVGDMERGLELALARNSLDAVEQAYTNLAAVKLMRGDLAGHDEMLARAEGFARRLGNKQRVRRLGTYRAGAAFHRGEWDRVLRFADEFLAECEAGMPHSNESDMRALRAAIRLARDNEEGALADCDRAVALARYVGRPDTSPDVLASAASIYLELGVPSEAALLIDEALSYYRGRVRFVSPELAWNADTFGRRPEVEEALARMPRRSGWRRAGELILAGRFDGAADVFARMDVRDQAARARMRVARELAARSRNEEAGAEAQRALAFYRSAGASRYASRAEALLTATRAASNGDGRVAAPGEARG